MKTENLDRWITSVSRFKKLITDTGTRLKIFVFINGNSGSASILKNNIEFHENQSEQFDVFFADTVKSRAIMVLMGVQKVPTTFFVRSGEVVDYCTGNMGREAFGKRLKELNSEEC